jgi:predicted Fe-Mo cluster-binding NifX family protein
MKLCIPTRSDGGLDAESSGHFGSAPWFTLVDTESEELTSIPNPESGRKHGTCHPLHRLREAGLDAVVCRNIGRGAYSQLQQQGIAVYTSQRATVSEVLAAAREGTLQPVGLDEACHGAGRHREQHRHGHGPCGSHG